MTINTPQKNLPPIVSFVYNKPWQTQRTLEDLEQNDLAAGFVTKFREKVLSRMLLNYYKSRFSRDWQYTALNLVSRIIR